MHEDGGSAARTPQAFTVLQEKYVSASVVRCCPTMDLIALLTVDGDLIVHRTISWQKLLHMKASEVIATMVAIEWSPDGLELAVGCDDGDVVVYDIETGTHRSELRGLRENQDMRHDSAIVAMHWVGTKCHRGDVDQRCSNAAWCPSRPDAIKASSGTGPVRRCARHPAVLTTADCHGNVVFWWMGRVFMTKTNILDRVQHQIVAHDKARLPPAQRRTLLLEKMMLLTDLSRLDVIVAQAHLPDGSSDVTDKTMGQPRALVAVNVTRWRECLPEITFIAQVAEQINPLLSEIVLGVRQIGTEWKMATRIFELKMGLLSSLYEKYGCEDTPQADMLTLVATGIASPALAQYFAQDIQEMSITRMKKDFFHGCDTLQKLLVGRIKVGWTQVLLRLSELRGRVKWRHVDYATTLGLTKQALDKLVVIVQRLLVEAERFGCLLQDVKQDFSLLFQWILECIRVHSSATKKIDSTTRASETGHSLLDQRRLCDFLRRAVDCAAHECRVQSNKYKVDSSFGNPVSAYLSASKGAGERKSSETLSELTARFEKQWFDTLKCISSAMSSSISVDQNDVVGLGETAIGINLHEFASDPVSHDEDCHLSTDGNSDEEAFEDELADIVDWHNLCTNSSESCGADALRETVKGPIPIAGVLLDDGALLLLRRQTTIKASEGRHLWHGAWVRCDDRSPIKAFDFYSSSPSSKQDHIVVLRGCRSPEGNSSIELHRYHSLPFSPLATTTPPEICRMQDHSIATLSGHTRVRIVPSVSVDPRAQVIACAARGVFCFLSSELAHLTIFDAEEDEDEDEADDDEPHSDSSNNEIDL